MAKNKGNKKAGRKIEQPHTSAQVKEATQDDIDRDHQEHAQRSLPLPQILEDVLPDQRQPIPRDRPPNSSQDRPFASFLESASDFQILGGNFHHVTHGPQAVNVNLAFHFNPPRREEYGIHQNSPLAPQLLASPSRIPNHNPGPPPTQSIAPGQFPPQSVYEQDPARSTKVPSLNSNNIDERLGFSLDDIMPSPSEIAKYVLAAHNIVGEDGITSLERRISRPADSSNNLPSQKVPKSGAVITQDEDRCSLINEDGEILPNASGKPERVLVANHIKEDAGAAFPGPKTEHHSVLRHLPIPLNNSTQNPSGSSSLSYSKSFASSALSEWQSVSSRTSTLDRASLSLASVPISPVEGELFKNINPHDILIGVMGPSGTGKSSFINTLFGSEVAVTSDGLLSCTQDVRAFHCPRPGHNDQKIVIVDTPGFDDTHRTDYDVLEGIASWLERTYSKDIKLSGILHFHSIQESKMRGTTQRHLGMFERLCGPKALKNVVLLTTFWDNLEQQSVGSHREKQLSEFFWKLLIDKGSRTERFDPRSYERAWEIESSISSFLPLPSRLPCRSKWVTSTRNFGKHLPSNSLLIGGHKFLMRYGPSKTHPKWILKRTTLCDKSRLWSGKCQISHQTQCPNCFDLEERRSRRYGSPYIKANASADKAE